MGILYQWNYFISLKHFWKELRPVIVIQSFKEAKNAALEEAKNVARILNPYFENI